MVHKKNSKRVSAILPAYNEEARIAAVLEVLTTYPGFKEVIVIDDGSTDQTEEIAKRYPIRYLRNNTNKGQGYSMERGVNIAKGDIIFFSDADIIGLNHKVLDEIIQPVINKKVEMMIGMINRRIYFLKFVLAFIPLLGGERALTRKLWFRIPHHFKNRFKIEAALNFYAKYYGRGFGFKVFPGLVQIIKEKKYGIGEGFKRRISMWKDIIAAQARLELVDIPGNVKNKRFIFLNIFADSFGMVFGLLFVIASQVGPVKFLLSIFSKKLIEDPDAPFIYFLLKIATLVSATILLYVGVAILALNLFFLVISLSRFFALRKEPGAKKIGVKNFG